MIMKLAFNKGKGLVGQGKGGQGQGKTEGKGYQGKGNGGQGKGKPGKDLRYKAPPTRKPARMMMEVSDED